MIKLVKELDNVLQQMSVFEDRVDKVLEKIELTYPERKNWDEKRTKIYVRDILNIAGLINVVKKNWSKVDKIDDKYLWFTFWSKVKPGWANKRMWWAVVGSEAEGNNRHQFSEGPAGKYWGLEFEKIFGLSDSRDWAAFWRDFDELKEYA